MIEEDYVSFETAKLLKEKGFDEYCLKNYWESDKELHGWTWELSYGKNSEKNTCCKDCSAPTLQMAMKWLREKHKLFIDITAAMEDYIEDGVVKYKDPYYTWEVFSLEIGETLYFGGTPNVKESYEEACDFAIKYCLENLV